MSTTTKTKSIPPTYFPTAEWVHEAISADDGIGWCVRCGAEASGVEPDARKYACESCGERGVYGAEEMAIMGWVR